MPVIIDNPRYERLALNLFTGMTGKDACLDAGFAISTAMSCTEIIKNPLIQDRIRELQEAQAQKVVNTGAIATLEERKRILTGIMRAKIEQPISAGHIIAATKEQNLMERVYTDTNTGKPGIVNITYVFNGIPAGPQAQAVPAIEIIEGEAQTKIEQAPKRVGSHIYTEEERAQIQQEVFGEDKPT